MQAPTNNRASRFRQAGLTYLLVGSAVVVFTVFGGLVPQSRTPQRFLLLPGLSFVLLFGLIITAAPWLWRWHWTVGPTRWLVRLLTITNTGRTLLFLLNAAGFNVHVMPALSVVRTAPELLFLVNAALAGLITYMLARAGWAREPVDRG
jgi:hypothetical protein